MNYDPNRHITHEMLADAAGMTISALTAKVRYDDAAPKVLCRHHIGRGKYVPYYDRQEALFWAVQVNPTKPRQVVPPCDINLMQRKPYKPGSQMRINQARTAELYPHSLKTGAGVGNGAERAHGFGRGA